MLSYIHELIDKNQGSISISSFMNAALYHKKHGYYMNKAQLGKDGDFITAPEISQLFGEIIAVWIMDSWEKLGKPQNFSLVELGPGKGTLIYDIARVTKKYNNFFNSISIHLIEISPIFRNIQKQMLKNLNINWQENIDNLPEQPTIFLANEFFDALPIDQFICLDKQWYENRVTKNFDSSLKVIQIGATESYHTCNPSCINFTLEKNVIFDGAVIEICPSAFKVLQKIEEKIYKNKGAALIIDYGYIYPPYQSTLQSIKRHNYANFLQDVGNIDITTLVNFQALKNSLQRINCEIFTQREFLYSFGIKERANILMKNANSIQKNRILNEFLRLTENMGTTFKAMLTYCL